MNKVGQTEMNMLWFFGIISFLEWNSTSINTDGTKFKLWAYPTTQVKFNLIYANNCVNGEQFKKKTTYIISGSVMHYTKNSFSRDGRSPTILPINSDVDFLGQRRGFSDKDLEKINKLYECNNGGNKGPVKPTVKPTPYQCKDNHELCPHWSKIGECRNNPNWMLVNCKQSCQQCGKQSFFHSMHLKLSFKVTMKTVINKIC